MASGMDKINILVATRLEKELQQRIAAIDRRIHVDDAADLLRAEEEQPSQSVGISTAHQRLTRLLAETEVMLLSAPTADLITRAPGLRWIQSVNAGVDNMAAAGLLESDIVITSASGIHAIPISEYVLGMMLMLVKRAPFCFGNQQRKKWEKITPTELNGKTAGIIGPGNIGREIARLDRAFRMRVVAVKR